MDKLKILVIGSGGREHAIVQALAKSKSTVEIYVYPGNDGMMKDAERVSGLAQPNVAHLVKWAQQNSVQLVIIGPEAELVAGYADEFRREGMSVFGPNKNAAQLEGSKIFAKNFMKKYSVPTARSAVVDSVSAVVNESAHFQPPFVLKADGLAAGKGVYICKTKAELQQAAKELFEEKKFGAAGERALLEEYLPGEELSVLVLTDGKKYEVLPYCRDHKRLLDGDNGPNTGGMGVVGPIPMDRQLEEKISSEVIDKTVAGLGSENFLFRGVIFIGLMLTEKGPQVLEYNVRFGDPETQVIMPLLNGDWAKVFQQVAQGQVPELRWRSEAVACVVLAAEGYPDHPKKNIAITGDLHGTANVQVLHAGTRLAGEGFVTNGGRVLNIVARGNDLTEALRAAYAKVAKIQWPGMQYRRDIGKM